MLTPSYTRKVIAAIIVYLETHMTRLILKPGTASLVSRKKKECLINVGESFIFVKKKVQKKLIYLKEGIKVCFGAL